MRLPRASRALVLALSLAAGCAAFDGPIAGAGGGATTGPGGDSTSGLPCDVAAVLEAHCLSCHGSTPSGGAPISLVTLADLTAASSVDPGATVAERCSVRMKDAARPMPPESGVTVSATEIAAFDAWVQAGIPEGSCNAQDPFSVPPQCSSQRYWSGEEGAGMDPGETCVACHTRSGEAPRFSLAGTVFPTGHEPDRCIAAGAQGAVVVITGADGRTLTLGANGSGNFSYSGSVATPYSAKVTFEGRERAMTAAQTSGDCNACHTQAGANDTPGRIVLP